MIDLQNLVDLDNEIEQTQNTRVFDELDNDFRLSIDKNINYLHCNIRSIGCNFDQFLVFIQSLNIPLHVIILTETWHGRNDSRVYSIPGFQMHCSPSIINKNDGIIIFASNKLDEVEFDVLNIIECNSVLLKFRILNMKYLACCIYRSPSFHDTSLFLNSLSNYLQEIKRNNNSHNTHIALIGDININLLSNDPHVTEYIDALNFQNFHSLINKPTRVTVNTNTCLDHIFVNNVIISEGVIIRSDVTDHDVVMLTIKNSGNRRPENKEKRIKKIIDHEALHNSLLNEQWRLVSNERSIDTAFTKFIEIFKTHISNHTAEKEIIINNKNLKPWMTAGIILEMKERNKVALIIKK